ncbi:receptor-mediated endocytosis protein 6 homolog isoform X2 [Agrilus planipennis]|uniref:Receptor-mediated endocytosis protein 6 homolog n=1 Tax=Agrilus planipennis TaxID=224129 RepID=A0A1W4WH39_AGRPL|nr:receptor-mediated endocytosis protein 6 homolog isoform X2 [Agrilus planipennis]
MDKRKDMDNIDSKAIDIIELITQLRNERLFVVSELKAIKAANEKVREIIDKLTQAAWMNLQKRIILNMLAMSSSKATAIKCWQNLNNLTNTVFVHAKDVLNQETSQFGELLQILRSKPEMLSHLLVLGITESSLQEEAKNVINSLTSGLYGALLLPEDVSLVLSLLQHLAKLELVTADNPRRKLRRKCCAFSQLYFLFHENLPAAKLFLTAALRKPIMQVIAKKDGYLDVDPEKTLSRFMHKKTNTRCLSEDEEIGQFRRKTVDELVYFATYFIRSIRESINCFPGSFAWLIGHVSDLMTKTYGILSREVREVNTDLIFTLFICPAIVHPEAYGICDISICEVVRHNLMQVAQILQAIALFNFNDLEPKYADFYALFEQESVYDIIGDLLKNSTNEHELGIDHVPEVARTSVLFTLEELHNLVAFLQKAITVANLSDDQDGPRKYLLQSIRKSTCFPSLKLITFLLNNLITVQQQQQSSEINRSSLITKSGGKGTQKKRSSSPNGGSGNKVKPTAVLVIPIHQDKIQHIGLLPEHKVVGIESTDEDNDRSPNELEPPENQTGSTIGIASSAIGSEKRIRFSRSHDESSVGNTSDNLEAVSEAASNHSVDSSVELENEDQNDNLSDMISANVSGRGTPNISGRDTPSSQVNDDEEGDVVEEPREAIEQEATIEVPEPPLPPARRQVQIIDKHTQNEIDDKFCKFEIKRILEGEETRSIISDTWSTDVLASDCETIDGNDVRGDQQNINLIMETGTLIGSAPPSGGTPLLDMSETKSESGWSTDVLASDSERLTEVDADDISVARLEDAVSIGRSDDGAGAITEANSAKHLKVNVLDLPCRSSSISQDDVNSRGRCNCQRCVLEYSVAGTNTSATTVAYQSINNFLQDADDGSERPEVRSSKSSSVQDQQRLSNNSEYNSNSSSSCSTSSLESHNKDSQMGEKNEGNEVRVINTTPKKPEGSFASSVLKSTSLNGAIPKSISFDMTAEKGSDDEQKEKRSFLGKFRIGFRNRRAKTMREAEEVQMTNANTVGPTLRRTLSEESSNFSFTGMCDDILAKYRKTVGDGTNSEVKVTVLDNAKVTERNKSPSASCSDEHDKNLGFSNVKKKLRLVLSNSCGYHSTIRVGGTGQVKSDLESYLQLELAKAHKLKCRSSARIAEALRCVKMFDEENCHKLCTILKEDYCQRSVYIQYLIQSRQLLLSILAFLEGLSEQIESEKELSSSYMATTCVKFFLERHEIEMAKFKKEFSQLTMVDEKCFHLKEFLQTLNLLIRKETVWQDDMELVEVAMERSVINEVYYNALYPNGDGDKDRDSVLRDHLQKLSKVINPNHKDLMISPCFQHECPWLPAQEALQDMASYRTPRDKVSCVLRSTMAIKDLLSLIGSKIPTADDFTPILVYVIIKANPPSLLSTIQYVNGFFGDWLQGEDLYWWTQFCAAVEFTKTMDYCD